MESGKLDESEDYLRESLEIHRHSLHEKHPNTAMRMSKCSIMSNQHLCVLICLDLYSITKVGRMSDEKRER